MSIRLQVQHAGHTVSDTIKTGAKYAGQSVGHAYHNLQKIPTYLHAHPLVAHTAAVVVNVTSIVFENILGDYIEKQADSLSSNQKFWLKMSVCALAGVISLAVNLVLKHVIGIPLNIYEIAVFVAAAVMARAIFSFAVEKFKQSSTEVVEEENKEKVEFEKKDDSNDTKTIEEENLSQTQEQEKIDTANEENANVDSNLDHTTEDNQNPVPDHLETATTNPVVEQNNEISELVETAKN